MSRRRAVLDRGAAGRGRAEAAPDDTQWIRDARPVKYAAIGPIAIHFPERVETNEQLQAENPSWDMELIHSKTGIAR